jgi:hypothetical protein
VDEALKMIISGGVVLPRPFREIAPTARSMDAGTAPSEPSPGVAEPSPAAIVPSPGAKVPQGRPVPDLDKTSAQ